VFRFQAIILRISHIHEQKTYIVLLSQEYGRCTSWWNKKNISGFDIGDIVEVFIHRDGSVNIIKNMELKLSAWDHCSSYEQIIGFLETIKIISHISIESGWANEVFTETMKLIRFRDKNTIEQLHYTLFQMRILKQAWFLDESRFQSSPVLRYMYSHITTTPLEKILTTRNVSTSDISIIHDSNLHTLYSLG
jgi:recombinational DNA repair protein (RecF pathway)